MRVIGGHLRGRRFDPPAGKWPTRPTTDFAREGLFNILQNRLDFEEIRMLDLFGGTGAHSLEFVSRGCTDVTWVDKHRPCAKFLKNLATEWGISDKIKVISAEAGAFLSNHKGLLFGYIFAGPPYPLPWLKEIPDRIEKSGLLKKGGLLVLEHNPRHNFANHPAFVEERSYGDTRFSFFIWR